jgi:hypothetical protein
VLRAEAPQNKTILCPAARQCQWFLPPAEASSFNVTQITPRSTKSGPPLLVYPNFALKGLNRLFRFFIGYDVVDAEDSPELGIGPDGLKSREDHGVEIITVPGVERLLQGRDS